MKQISSILIDREALEKLGMPIFIGSVDGIFIFCNQAFADFLGISKKNILGHTVHKIAPKQLADLYFAADKELLESASYQTYNSLIQTVEVEIKVTFNKVVIYTQNHKIAGLIGTIDAPQILNKRGLNNLKSLTPRELEVLGLLAKGQSVKAIASTLAISCHTVSDYLKSIYLKLDVHSKNEALFKTLSLFTITP